MATIRLSPCEVQVDEVIYEFEGPESADAFEACVATTDVNYCQAHHSPIAMRASMDLSEQVLSVASVPSA